MIRAVLLGLALTIAAAAPAAAHKLKVFATVDGDAVGGYAFFIGGGRAQGTPWTARDENGAEIAAGTTDRDGGFRFVPPPPVTGDVTVTVDTREGHIASATITAARFGTVAGAAPAPEETGAIEAPDAAGSPDPPAVTAETAALIEAAVQHQVAPLLERIEAMDDRLRFTDVMSGIFLIVGLAGIGLWARGRRP